MQSCSRRKFRTMLFPCVRVVAYLIAEMTWRQKYVSWFDATDGRASVQWKDLKSRYVGWWCNENPSNNRATVKNLFLALDAFGIP